MQVLIRGLHRDVTEQMLRDKLSPYAPVNSVELVRDGDPDHPWAFVDLGVDVFSAWNLLRRFDRQYFAGSMMRWYIPAHQD
ncbi:molybdenum cofactor biosynthesis protein MoaA [Cupriavidus sp. USMAA2-4]|uniref:Molybdenum cofactor biosynthesis protein MoaA n=1 Tax=Cupriavidus malaysiensis TaxID=367825 RepID=A0ABN4TDP5_9BURK|nr:MULTISPECIES: RNA-binding protein [Cupriavidus]AOY91603.1 molybdenum cofactor biosynthesis protein MoaA [Cupriavidus sp. USMAA2-4]AOY98847.1 molybdenum cofactor biosynthesis protein MoaA [Cupriavidus sp. USMAHM13]AOZ05272.1 molybdenum cofactor biosynthesis protein MoaA [Cupriavidus malaysiensis]